MKCLLRMVRYAKWIDRPSVLTPEYIQDLLKDITPDLIEEDKLSVFLVDNNSNKDIEIVTIGLTSNRTRIQKFEYILVSFSEISKVFEIEKSKGDTPYPPADKLHRNIIINSEADLIKLLQVMHKKGRLKSTPKPDVQILLESAKKKLIKNKMNDNMLKQLKLF